MTYLRNILFFTVFIVFIFSSTVISAENLSNSAYHGDWEGHVKLPNGGELPIVFHVSNESNKWVVTMDSPKQGAFGIPVVAKLEDNTMHFAVEQIGLKFSGQLNGGQLAGEFSQGPFKTPLRLSKTQNESYGLGRPQHPQPPYDYEVEEVTFTNKNDNVELAGTLTRPKKQGAFPAVVLISGSGQQDRDQTIFGHKPFLVIADQLTRAGFAVLRYDDRGVGGSKGEVKNATSQNLANDAQAALDLLRQHPNINPDKIGLLGHSEGALIAQIIASESKDLAFVVLLAGPGVSGSEIMAQQNYDVRRKQYPKNTYEQYHAFFNSARENISPESLYKLSKELFPHSDERMHYALVEQLKTPWMQFFLNFEPDSYLAKIRTPVLAVFGSLDIQVDAQINAKAMESNLKKHKHPNYQIEILAGLNHLFQTAETGYVDEYARIEETFSPEALKLIKDWLITII